MTRIIAGTLSGRKLLVPDSARPTTEMVREAMFSTLNSWQAIGQKNVLDLFSGSGGLGFEALSRGAAHVTFVESDEKAVAILKKNAENLQVTVEIKKQSAMTFSKSKIAESLSYDLVLIDPPYRIANDDIIEIIKNLILGAFLSEAAILVLERPTRDPFTWPAPIEELKNKRYGDNTLYYGSVA
jgi:16S rRNA (guanine966-N2)-methyltransferase